MPTFLFPAWVQQITLIVPTRWAISGLDAVTWRGLGALAAAPSVGALLAFGAAFTALAVWRFGRERA